MTEQVTDEHVEAACVSWHDDEKWEWHTEARIAETLRRDMRRVLEQYEASRATPAPQGDWVMVPREPTQGERDVLTDDEEFWLRDAAKILQDADIVTHAEKLRALHNRLRARKP